MKSKIQMTNQSRLLKNCLQVCMYETAMMWEKNQKEEKDNGR